MTRLKAFWRRIPLRIQGVAFVSLLVLIVVAILTHITMARDKANFRSELEDQAALLVTTLSQSIRDPLLNLQASQLLELAEAMDSSGVVTQVRIYKAGGVPLINTPDDGVVFTRDVDPLGATLVETAPDQMYFEWQDDHLVAGHVVSVGSQRLGAVAVNFSTAPLAEKLEDTQTQSVGVAIIAMVVSIGLGWIVIGLFTKPIANLHALAVQMSEGDLALRADEIQPTPELTSLALAFNQMLDSLQRMIRTEEESSVFKHTISDYMAFVEQVANGDLTVRLQANGSGGIVEENDDLRHLGTNLNMMVESLSEISRQVHNASGTLSTAAVNIQAAATLLTATVVEQDAAITQTMATVEEIRAIIEQTAERAQMVAQSSRQSIDVARSGEMAVQDTIDGMEFIRQRVESIAENILMLSERTQRIGAINETVNALADQSKLLALNASIEAARAGEEGRGFAVVAMEVRQLAEQSRAATDQVNGILSEIQQATASTVMVTEEGTKSTEDGMEQTMAAGNAIRDLATTIEDSVQAATQIAASTRQQTNGIDQLATAMAQIKYASSQSADSTRQVEVSVRDLTHMVNDLEQVVARYRLSN